MRIDIITLFPEVFKALEHSIPGRAQKFGKVEIHTHDIREFAINRYGQIDDSPFGGESGMVLRPEPLAQAIAKAENEVGKRCHRIFTSADGQTFNQKKAETLSERANILIICGHYKGIDERIRQHYIDEELSLGDYVLSGGEFAALVIIDAVSRLLPGVLGEPQSAETDSFTLPNRLGWPVYTRPEEFEGWKVPSVLLSGHHARIQDWKVQQSLIRTRERRPDLFEKLELSPDEQKIINKDF